jgi:hypothetical protein
VAYICAGIVKTGNYVHTTKSRTRVILFSKSFFVFGSKLLVDFLHVQYTDLMPYWRHSKTPMKRMKLRLHSILFYLLLCRQRWWGAVRVCEGRPVRPGPEAQQGAHRSGQLWGLASEGRFPPEAGCSSVAEPEL